MGRKPLGEAPMSPRTRARRRRERLKQDPAAHEAAKQKEAQRSQDRRDAEVLRRENETPEEKEARLSEWRTAKALQRAKKRDALVNERRGVDVPDGVVDLEQPPPPSPPSSPTTPATPATPPPPKSPKRAKMQRMHVAVSFSIVTNLLLEMCYSKYM